MNPVGGLMALNSSEDVKIDTDDGLEWFLYDSIISIVGRMLACEGVSRGAAFTKAKVCVTY